MRVLGYSLILVLFTSLTACDMKKKMDKMSENTETMTKTTQKMGESTENLEKTSDNLSEETRTLILKMREVESVNTQTEHFGLLKSAEAPDSKFNAACIYMAAFEFQHWFVKFEDQKMRERLYLKAVEHFFSVTSALVQDDMPVDPLFPSNEWMMLSSLAAGMGKIHPDQLADAAEKGYTPMSFYDVLKAGLAAESAYKAHEPIAEYQLRILQKRKVVQYVLQLRHNYLNLIALSDITSFEEAGFLGLNRAWMFLNGWELDLDGLEQEDLSYLNEILWKAVETQDYMRSLGWEVKHSGVVNQLYAGGRFYVNKRPEDATVPLRERGALMSLEDAKQAQGQGFFLSLLRESLNARGPLMQTKGDCLNVRQAGCEIF